MKGCRQEHSLDFSAIFKSALKLLNFGMWASFYLRNIALKIFSLVCSSFAKNLIFLTASFGDLLFNEKRKKSFVLLNNEVTEALHLPPVVQTDTSFIFV